MRSVINLCLIDPYPLVVSRGLNGAFVPEVNRG